VAIFHVLDPVELEFPFEDPTLFLSMEDERRIEANPLQLKEGYLEVFGRFLQDHAPALPGADCDYELLRTDESLEQGLVRFLSRRERLAGGAP